MPTNRDLLTTFVSGDGLLTDVLVAHVGPRQLVGVDFDSPKIKTARKFGFYQLLGAPADKNADKWLVEKDASCLVIAGERV